MRAPRRRRAAAGFTLLELVVALAVLALATMIASRLLLESQLRLAHAARRALDPAATIALEQVRADVRASAGVPARDFEWSWEPLVLAGHPAGEVRYRKLGADLVREIYAGGGALPSSERVVVRGVKVWRWRRLRGVPLPLVEIELGFRETPRLGLLAAAGQRAAEVSTLRSRRVVVSPRQAGGKRGW